MTTPPPTEAERYVLGHHEGFYARWIEDAALDRQRTRRQRLRQVVKSEDMAWDDSEHGRMKHVLNEYMDYPLAGVNSYILELPPGGASGRHQHAAEEVAYVIEGSGSDLHWDPVVSLDVAFSWSVSDEPKRWDWRAGDFVYIPPFVTHQHVNPSADQRARILLSTNRVYKTMGFSHLVQHTPAPEPGSEQLLEVLGLLEALTPTNGA